MSYSTWPWPGSYRGILVLNYFVFVECKSPPGGVSNFFFFLWGGGGGGGGIPEYDLDLFHS